ncbi:serine/threonine protein kinase [Candidatus Uabimicrobium amorphum]|uniref:Serine/threonine protein kinase n=1 Tax=Uabimicrobium amorphum TaxID=2596890 RepID=A0A5S9IKX2_UABAM|nr:serine/threonine-protein kinase [Candidatus Uabimicrobium amorphum]BBM82950.1 serine/threonine protein kinase [Candidatus Uabimicrobium amorphum]
MIVGDYKLLKLLGRGGVGRVFLAQSQANRRYYAIKETYHSDRDSNARFRREYNFLSAIDHPNIVKAYDFLTLKDKSFMVMEYVQGVSLTDFIKDNTKLPTKDLLAIAIQVARSVEVVNAAGIVHRDIKPDNIMIDSEKHLVKILDLGMGKHLDAFCDSQKLTKAGAVVGTLDYMSPEQMNGQLYENSDVFSVAATLYQLFSWQSRSIFASESMLHTMNNIANKRVPPFATSNLKRNEIATYKSIHAILKKALRKDLTKRTESCRELAQQLNNVYLQTRGRSTWKPSSHLDRQSILSLEKIKQSYIGSEQLPSRTNRFKKRKKHNFLPLAFGVGLALLVLTMVMMIPRGKRDKKITFGELLRQMQLCEKKQDFKKLCKLIDQLDTINDAHFFHQYKPQNDKEKFIRRFYNKNWEQKTLDLGAKLLRNEKNVLNLLYNVRLFVCKAEYALATWYSGIVSRDYPKFFEMVRCPAFKIAIRNYHKAFYLLRSWDVAQRLTMEKECCQFFLDVTHLKLYAGKNLGRWDEYELPRTIRNSFFTAVYNCIKTDFNDQRANQKKRNRFLIVQKAANQIPNHKSIHHIVHRIAALQVELQQNFISIKKNLQPFIEKYPDFLPSKILVYDILTKHEKPKILHDRGNYEETKGTVYQCILAYLNSKDLEKQKAYINFLFEHFPKWDFSYFYKAGIEPPFQSAMTFFRGLQISYRIFGRVKINWALFNREQRFHFVLEMKWFVHVLREYSTQPIIRYRPFLKNLEQSQKQLQNSMRKMYSQDKELLDFLLYNKQINNYQRILNSGIRKIHKHVVRHAIMSNQYNVALDMLHKEKDAFLESVALIHKYRKTGAQELLPRIAQLLKSCAEKDPNIPNHIIFTLHGYEIVEEFIQQQRYEEAREIYRLCSNHFYISTKERLLYAQKIQSKLDSNALSHSQYAEENNALLQKYMDKKAYAKVKKLASYNKYTIQLHNVSAEELAKFNNILQVLQDKK